MGSAPDWSECLHILAAFCQFLLAWLLPCAWPQPVGLLAVARFAAWPAVGEDVFLLLQGLEMEAHDGELILVRSRRFCNFGCGIRWLVVMWWELSRWVFPRGSGIILVVLQRRVCGFPLLWCHRGLVYELGTWWTPLLGSRLPYNPIKMHTRRLNRVRRQSFALVLARVQYVLVGGIYTPNLCYIMTIMPSLIRNIRGIFRAKGHFIQVGVYKLSTLSDS